VYGAGRSESSVPIFALTCAVELGSEECETFSVKHAVLGVDGSGCRERGKGKT